MQQGILYVWVSFEPRQDIVCDRYVDLEVSGRYLIFEVNKHLCCRGDHVSSKSRLLL